MLHAVSIGHRLDLTTPRHGEVLGVYPGAWNLLLDGRLVTVLPGGNLGRGPTFLDRGVNVLDRGVNFLDRRGGGRRVVVAGRLPDPARGDPARGDPAPPGQPGQPGRRGVHVRAGLLAVGDVVIDTRTARRWQPVPITWGAASAQRLADLAPSAPGAWPGTRLPARHLADALAGDGPGSPRAGRALLDLVGLGPGATPSGDDVLVGLVAGLHGAGTPFAEAVLSWLRAEPAATWARTTPLSAHLLRDALDGDVADPLATFVSLLADPGASADALANARTAVLATGATSGADTCVGLALAGSLLIHPAPSLPCPEGSLA